MEEVDNFESPLSELEFLSPPPEVPVNQSSISCNDQGGQNNVINDSIQQTTPFPTSFPETMMEGFQPSFMEEVDNFESLLSELEFHSYVILKHILSEDDCLQFSYSSVYPIIPKKQYNVVTVHGSRPPPEVPVNQSSISCNDQGGQNNVINYSIQQTTPFPTSFPETMMEGFQPSSMDDDLFDLQSPLLSPPPEVPVNQSSISCSDQGGQNNVINDSIQQTTPFPTLFPETMTGHRYMTQNATTSQHGEFNQPGPSSPAPWYHTLNKLRESEFRDIDEKVFRLLRFSYDRLGDLALKQCLLYCALFPEDYVIGREELIGYLIDEGIIKGKRSRGNAFDEGHTMLNRLEYVCLLESAKMDYDDSRCVKMHDLIRDMAIQILQENSQVMVKAELQELPDAEEWTENLTRVSLMQNNIEEFPSSYSPRCPYLSTLFLCDNIGLRLVADSFFKQLHRLKVLDLSFTNIENLPDSVSDLVSLVALLLKYCQNLSNVPSLKKLRALKRLDLSGTALEKMPQGMECLTNLRYLRMNGCGEKEFPSGILPKLSHLQVFVLEQFTNAPITVKGKEVGSLRNLETLECHFEGFSDLMEYLRSRDGILSLSTCKILVGEVGRYGIKSLKTVGLGNLSINGDRDFQVKFLNGIQGLICECIDARSLCDVLSLENATELERISIRECHNMESLVSSSWFCSAPPRLPSCNGTFSGLKRFFCYDCKSMKKLFPLVLLPNLVNLERIKVSFCKKMEEIIGTTDEESSTSKSITEVILPKLIALELVCLPELKSICSAKLICNSLKDIDVTSCEKLKRIPICLPLLENSQPSPPPSL